jgi:integrase
MFRSDFAEGIPRGTNAPAAQERPGAGNGIGGSDAPHTLRLEEEALMASYEPLEGHPGFYRRAGSVAFRFRDQRGRRRWATAPTIAAAERLKIELELDVRRGEFRERRSPYFGAYAAEWIETYTGRTSRGISEDTPDDYRRRLNAEAIPFFGRMRLAEIEPRDVKAFVAEIGKRGISQNTVRLGLAPVRALLATALEEGLIRTNPAAGLRLFVQRDESADHEDDVKALDEHELVALLTEIPERERLFFEFLAQTGLRIGEAIEVRWGDVDLGERWLHVRRRHYRGRVAKPKGRKTRRLRLTAAMARDLWALRKATRAGDGELVFTAARGGRISPPNLMSRVLKPAALRAELGEWPGFHTFRHTCATMLFRNGWNAVQVQKFLGHADPGFTLRTYVHLLPEDLPDPGFLEAVTAPACDQDATTMRPEQRKLTQDAQAAR